MIINNINDLISFREVKIPEIEVLALRDLENFINKKFKLVKKDTLKGSFEGIFERIGHSRNIPLQFSVNENYVERLCIIDPFLCDECYYIVKRGDRDPPTESDCRECGFSRLPDSIGNFRHLNELLIYSGVDHGFIYLPETIGNLKDLQKLVLWGIPLEILPESLGNLRSLRSLYIILCKLKKIPDNIFRYMEDLKLLQISHSEIKVIPKTIGALYKLEYLIINSSKLEDLPSSIKTLAKLKHLYLNNNKFNNLPWNSINLTSLEVLDLQNNDNLHIPDFFDFLLKAKQIQLKK